MLYQLLKLILLLIDFYQMALVVYFLLSWLPGARQSKLGQVLEQLCEPYVSVFRRYIPPVGSVSFAGIAALLSLTFIEYGVQTIFRFLILIF